MKAISIQSHANWSLNMGGRHRAAGDVALKSSISALNYTEWLHFGPLIIIYYFFFLAIKFLFLFLFIFGLENLVPKIKTNLHFISLSLPWRGTPHCPKGVSCFVCFRLQNPRKTPFTHHHLIILILLKACPRWSPR